MDETKPILGSIQPRYFPAPLGLLTRRTTLGYEALDFWRDELKWTPLPHQRWLILHLEELLPDGSPRWRSACITQPRRNGKTAFGRAYALWNLKRGRSSLFSSASLPTARETWQQIKYGAEDMGWSYTARGANSQESVTVGRASFQVLSANENSARGRDAEVVMVDELRAHRDRTALDAIESCADNHPDAKLLYFSNAGDIRAEPLARMLALGRSGEEPSLFVAVWAPHNDECAIDDVQAWQQANPALGRTIQLKVLRSAMGTKPPASFRTENLNQTVMRTDAVVTGPQWDSCFDPGEMDAHRDRVALGFDVAADMSHATLVAAVKLSDGRVRVATVWAGSLMEARIDVPDLVKSMKPKAFGWFPGSSVNAMNSTLKALKVQRELTGADSTGACMGLADMIAAGRLAHSGDELLGSSILQCGRQKVSDAWRFSRDGTPTDAAYAMAGAAFLAQNLPETDLGLFIV